MDIKPKTDQQALMMFDRWVLGQEVFLSWGMANIKDIQPLAIFPMMEKEMSCGRKERGQRSERSSAKSFGRGDSKRRGTITRRTEL